MMSGDRPVTLSEFDRALAFMGESRQASETRAAQDRMTIISSIGDLKAELTGRLDGMAASMGELAAAQKEANGRLAKHDTVIDGQERALHSVRATTLQILEGGCAEADRHRADMEAIKRTASVATVLASTDPDPAADAVARLLARKAKVKKSAIGGALVAIGAALPEIVKGIAALVQHFAQHGPQ